MRKSDCTRIPFYMVICFMYETSTAVAKTNNFLYNSNYWITEWKFFFSFLFFTSFFSSVTKTPLYTQKQRILFSTDEIERSKKWSCISFEYYITKSWKNFVLFCFFFTFFHHSHKQCEHDFTRKRIMCINSFTFWMNLFIFFLLFGSCFIFYCWCNIRYTYMWSILFGWCMQSIT